MSLVLQNAVLRGNGIKVNPRTQEVNPFPNKHGVSRVYRTSLLKTLWEKDKFLSNLKLLSAISYSLEESKICWLGKG